MVYFLFIIIVTPGVYPRLVLAQVPCVARGIFRTLLKKLVLKKKKNWPMLLQVIHGVLKRS